MFARQNLLNEWIENWLSAWFGGDVSPKEKA
jgi:hypothetical protein